MIFKKILVGSSLSLLSIVLMLMLSITALGLVVRPENIKRWINQSGLYNSLGQVLTEQVQQQPVGPVGGESVDKAVINTAIEKALPPDFLQKNTESIVDGTFNWLDGTTTQPDFVIDVSDAKRRFAESIGTNYKERFNKLPVCPRTLPKTTDPMTIDCKPQANVNIDEEVNKIVTQIQESKDFLPDTFITANTLKTNKDGVSKSVFQDLSDIPIWYQRLKIAPLALLVLAIILAVVVVFGSTTKLSGISRVGRTVAIAGLLSLSLVWLSGILFDKATTALQSNTSKSVAMQGVAVKLVKSVQSDFAVRVFWLGGITAALGIAAWTIAFVIKRKQPFGTPGQIQHVPIQPQNSTLNNPKE